MKEIKNYKPFRFQMESILKLKNICIENGGCMILDETGLGKTITSATLAINLKENPNILVVCNKSNFKSWSNVLKNYDGQSTICTVQKLEVRNDYDVIIIDEAHNYRNPSNKSYIDLFKLINKQIERPYTILVTATPFNNNFTELCNIFRLIPFKTNSLPFNILGSICENLIELEKKKGIMDMFDLHMKSFQHINKSVENRIGIKHEVDNLKEVMSFFCVRNTRENIKLNYPDDLERMGKFPEIRNNERIQYEDQNLNEFIYFLVKELNKMPLVRQNYTMSDNDINFVGLYKSLLLKRLDSSVYAFKNTINKSYQILIDMMQFNGLNVFTFNDKKYEVNDDFWDKLLIDKLSYERIIEKMNSLSDDVKIEKLFELIRNTSDKIVIFTEYTDTLELLVSEAKKNNIKFIEYSSKSNAKVLDEVLYEFDANVPKNEQKNKIQCIFASDVLSEGISLHRANNVIHFDSRWNPARLTQRNGRVDRIYIGGENKNVSIDTFGVPSIIENIIELENRIDKKSFNAETILNFDFKNDYSFRFEYFNHKTKNFISISEELKYYTIIRGEINDFIFERDFYCRNLKFIPKLELNNLSAIQQNNYTFEHYNNTSLNADKNIRENIAHLKNIMKGEYVSYIRFHNKLYYPIILKLINELIKDKKYVETLINVSQYFKWIESIESNDIFCNTETIIKQCYPISFEIY